MPLVQLIPVYRERQAVMILYDLLKERTPEQSISHKKMPTMEEHVKFVHSRPYLAWYLIQNEESEYVGSTYLSRQREIGIFIFKRYQGRGYGSKAVRQLMDKWPGRFLANINPQNTESQRFFENLGAKLIQYTYEL